MFPFRPEVPVDQMGRFGLTVIWANSNLDSNYSNTLHSDLQWPEDSEPPTLNFEPYHVKNKHLRAKLDWGSSKHTHPISLFYFCLTWCCCVLHKWKQQLFYNSVFIEEVFCLTLISLVSPNCSLIGSAQSYSSWHPFKPSGSETPMSNVSRGSNWSWCSLKIFLNCIIFEHKVAK